MAFAWGFAEASFFFIAPDVLFTRIAIMRGWRKALRACVWGLAGAMLGGGAIYFLAATGHAAGIDRLFDWIPGINPKLMASARDGLDNNGVTALFSGTFRGIPYKLYAAHAGASHIDWVIFFIVSAAARFMRFAASSTLAWLIATTALRPLAQTRIQLIHLVFWTVSYAFYFWIQRG